METWSRQKSGNSRAAWRMEWVHNQWSDTSTGEKNNIITNTSNQRQTKPQPVTPKINGENPFAVCGTANTAEVCISETVVRKARPGRGRHTAPQTRESAYNHLSQSCSSERELLEQKTSRLLRLICTKNLLEKPGLDSATQWQLWCLASYRELQDSDIFPKHVPFLLSVSTSLSNSTVTQRLQLHLPKVTPKEE